MLATVALAAHGLALAWRRWHAAAALCLLIGASAIGALRCAWFDRSWQVTLTALGSAADDPRRLVCVEGIVVSEPRADESCFRDALLLCDTCDEDTLARFVPETPSVRFNLAIDLVRDGAARHTALAATVRVAVEGSASWCIPGDRVQVLGWLSPCSRARNPGGFDSLQWGRSRGIAATLAVADCALITRLDQSQWSLTAQLARWRSFVDGTMRSALDSQVRVDDSGDLAPHNRLDIKALIAASTTGAAWPGLRSVSKSFAACGVQHLVAISGFNFGILAACAVWCVRRCTLAPRVTGGVLVALAILFVASIESEVSSVRAALMGGSAALALAFNRALSFGSVLSGAAIVIVLCDPLAASEPGFQLSFAAILGLHSLAPPLSRLLESCVRGFGVCAALTRLALVPVAASIAAWTATAPIVALHFESCPLWCVPCTLVLSPSFAVMVISANAMVVLQPVAPALASVARHLATANAQLILATVRTCAELPGAVTPSDSVRAVTDPHDWVFRVDMFDVGNGSCYLVRSRGSAVVFDCGSLGAAAVGSRTVVPALSALGVRSLDAVFVSHPNLDHYGALPEVVRTFNVPRVILTPQFLVWAQRERSAASCALVAARSAGASIETSASGDEHQFGETVWRVIHPDRSANYADSNDGSLVIRIDCGLFSALFAGDAAREACETILTSSQQHHLQGITLFELPHHGSFRPESAALAQRVSSEIVLQSTGSRRLLKDPWSALFSNTTRLITARDRACAVAWKSDGSIVLGAWDGTTYLWRASSIRVDTTSTARSPVGLGNHKHGSPQDDCVADGSAATFLDLNLERPSMDRNVNLHRWVLRRHFGTRELTLILAHNNDAVTPCAHRWWHLRRCVEGGEPLGDFVDEPQRPPDFEARGGERCVLLCDRWGGIFAARQRLCGWRKHCWLQVTQRKNAFSARSNSENLLGHQRQWGASCHKSHSLQNERDFGAARDRTNGTPIDHCSITNPHTHHTARALCVDECE